MRVDLPGLTRHRRPSGAWKYRVRAEHDRERRVTLPCGPEHPEFTRCYAEARRGVTPKLEAPDLIPRSFAWLVRRYEEHMAEAVKAGAMDAATERQRSAFYARLLPAHGQKHMAMPTAKVIEIRDGLAATPGAADNMVKALSALYRWAAERGLVDANPAKGVARLIRQHRGAVPWSVEDLQRFRDRHPKGTMAHLALTLFTFTACRIGDAPLLGRMNERRDGAVTWLEWEPGKKGSKPVSIPILPPLAEAIAAQKVAGPTYLLNAHGQPFASSAAFGNWFRDRVREAGLEDRSAHGIRKAAGELMALQGATQYHIMAVHGHGQARTSEVYTQGVNRRRLAAEAMEKLRGMAW
ncbi:tyrosine-type recombinase/integrase [Roseicyclus marinus]|uniref:tyrosine-type recombinase/integrase n=1 Tax=Roseicyclus marinus TaxID=2161673 RepID=UPI0024104C23|nr:tyrosine-type recombinase/integrase [Roseicyclus marinus]MDG3040471.1 tyrosine-type recombinase/integrase [Roseicyclus marinus]